MVQANELRLGNWVHLIDDDINDPIKITLPYLEICNQTPEKFNPIPLTPELLEKCGFEKNEELRYSNVAYFKKKDFTITQVRDSWEVSYGLFGSMALICKSHLSLHRLQNIFFALLNKELEVNL